jgi:hypothetical protein
MVIASSGHTTKMHAHGRCRSRGRTERAHRSLENRSERGFPQRPHAASLFWRKKEQNPRCQPASHTKFLTLPENDLPRHLTGPAQEGGFPCPREWIPLHTIVDPLAHESGSPCAEVVHPILRSGAVSPRVSCSPFRDLVRGRHSARTPRARITSPPDDTRCPARMRSVRPRHNQGIPDARWRGGAARRASPRRALRVHRCPG